MRSFLRRAFKRSVLAYVFITPSIVLIGVGVGMIFGLWESFIASGVSLYMFGYLLGNGDK